MLNLASECYFKGIAGAPRKINSRASSIPICCLFKLHLNHTVAHLFPRLVEAGEPKRRSIFFVFDFLGENFSNIRKKRFFAQNKVLNKNIHKKMRGIL
jgi:hypothetical protein